MLLVLTTTYVDLSYDLVWSWIGLENNARKKNLKIQNSASATCTYIFFIQNTKIIIIIQITTALFKFFYADL